MEYINFEELRKLALVEQIPDNKVSIGIWAKIKGYKKKRKQKHNVVSVMYYLDRTK